MAAAATITAYLPNRPRRRDPSGLMKNLRRRPDGRYRRREDPRAVACAREDHERGLGRHIDDQVRRLRQPMYLIRGRVSELVSAGAAEAFLTLAPHTVFTDVADAGHLLAGDRNDAFNSVLMTFLSAHRGV